MRGTRIGKDLGAGQVWVGLWDGRTVTVGGILKDKTGML